MDSQREKRQKTTQDAAPSSSSQPIQVKDVRALTLSANVPELHLETREPPAKMIVQRELNRPTPDLTEGSSSLVTPSRPSLGFLFHY